jgi:hypothetical protein
VRMVSRSQAGASVRYRAQASVIGRKRPLSGAGRA